MYINIVTEIGIDDKSKKKNKKCKNDWTTQRIFTSAWKGNTEEKKNMVDLADEVTVLSLVDLIFFVCLFVCLLEA